MSTALDDARASGGPRREQIHRKMKTFDPESSYFALTLGANRRGDPFCQFGSGGTSARAAPAMAVVIPAARAPAESRVTSRRRNIGLLRTPDLLDDMTLHRSDQLALKRR